MKEIKNKQDYLRFFKEKPTGGTKQEKALEHALDIRKFEIELYWKRAAYFWTFIAAAFAGYFLVQKNGPPYQFEINFIISCLGFVFSVGWYFVNRGSKAWLKNWEKHVDLLEDDIIGHLYKTRINPNEYRFFNLLDAYPFSVSRTNQILSLYVIGVWLFLIAYSFKYFQEDNGWNQAACAFFGIATFLSVLCMFFRGRSRRDTVEEINLSLREYKKTD